MTQNYWSDRFHRIASSMERIASQVRIAHPSMLVAIRPQTNAGRSIYIVWTTFFRSEDDENDVAAIGFRCGMVGSKSFRDRVRFQNGESESHYLEAFIGGAGQDIVASLGPKSIDGPPGSYAYSNSVETFLSDFDQMCADSVQSVLAILR